MQTVRAVHDESARRGLALGGRRSRGSLDVPVVVILDERSSLSLASDTDIARAIAEQVVASGRSQTWRKMTTILAAYKLYRLTAATRLRLEAAFAGAGLDTQPSMRDVDRSATVRLSVSTGDVVPAVPTVDQTGLPGLSVRAREGAEWREARLHTDPTDLLIVDVDVSTLADRERLEELLLRTLGGVDHKALTDLLEPDRHASFKRRKPGEIPRASIFVVVPDQEQSQQAEAAVLLCLGLIELGLGPGWLLVVRHPPTTYVGGVALDDDPRPQPGADYLESLADWGLSSATSAEELALTVISQAVYSLSRAKTELDTTLELWRTDSRAGNVDNSVLVDLQVTAPLILQALEPLQHPSATTFVGQELLDQARDVRDQVGRDIDSLRTFQGTVAAALAQADRAQSDADQAHNERYQASLATLAGVLLAPGLVASIFGANQMLSDSPLSLVWLFALMVIAGSATWWVIRYKLHPGRKTSKSREAPVPSAAQPRRSST